MLNQELGKNVRGVSAEAMLLLRQHPWPGSVRRTAKRALKYALVHAAGETLTPDSLPASCKAVPEAPAASAASPLAA